MQAFARALVAALLFAATLAFAGEGSTYKAAELDRQLGEYIGLFTSFGTGKKKYSEAFAAGNIFASLTLEAISKERKEDEESRKWAGISQANNVAPILRELASSDMRAQMVLGFLYRDGIAGMDRDDALAFQWINKSAEQGYAAAQNYLGYMYAQGRGVPKDDIKAAEWLRKSAEQAFAPAQNNLGYMYQEGRGVPKDDAKAAELYRKSAEQGYATAQYNLVYGLALESRVLLHGIMQGLDAHVYPVSGV